MGFIAFDSLKTKEFSPVCQTRDGPIFILAMTDMYIDFTFLHRGNDDSRHSIMRDEFSSFKTSKIYKSLAEFKQDYPEAFLMV